MVSENVFLSFLFMKSKGIGNKSVSQLFFQSIISLFCALLFQYRVFLRIIAREQM